MFIFIVVFIVLGVNGPLFSEKVNFDTFEISVKNSLTELEVMENI